MVITYSGSAEKILGTSAGSGSSAPVGLAHLVRVRVGVRVSLE